MATGGSGVSVTSDKRESLTCALCLDIFRHPKLLPCSHTYCETCLEDLIQRRPGRPFPCPACRKDIEVPAEGAAGFQNNFYLDEEELERARNDTVCSVHLNKKLEMFCVECDLLICMDCKLAVHLHHKTQSLQGAKKDAEEQLSKDTVRLRQMREHIEEIMPEWRTNQDEFQTKKAAVERKIRHRHATLVAEADRYLKEALQSLEQACSDAENTLSTELQTAQDKADKLQNLQQKMDAALENGESCKIVNMAREVRTGCGSQENVQKMEVKPVQHVSRPVHRADIPADDVMFISMRNFIGTGELRTYDHVDPEVTEVTVTEVTRCGEHEDSVVFCVCPGDDKTLVAFQSSYQGKGSCVKELSATGEMKSVTQYKRGTNGEFISKPHSFSGYLHSFVQSRSSDNYKIHRFIVDTNRNIGQMELVTVMGEPAKNIPLFSVNCGPHRAIDINSTEEVFVVMEKSSTYNQTRQVKLFQWGGRHKEAIDVYRSPLTPWRPADVRFFTLAGEEVLLIADEANDAIHVVKVKDERMTFSRFLTPGCPLLVQPTALNTDRRGRLWVGCRGGLILTVDPGTEGAAAAVTAVDGDDDNNASDGTRLTLNSAQRRKRTYQGAFDLLDSSTNE